MPIPVTFEKFTITLNPANTIFQVSTNAIVTSQIELHCPGANGGSVYIGNLNLDATWIPRAAGSTTVFTASDNGDLVTGTFFDLSKVYLLGANAGDTAIVQYVVRV